MQFPKLFQNVNGLEALIDQMSYVPLEAMIWSY